MSIPCCCLNITDPQPRRKKHRPSSPTNTNDRDDIWENLILEESRIGAIIKHIIDAKVQDRNIDLMECLDRQDLVIDLESKEYQSQSLRQAVHAYHVLFRGTLDAVKVCRTSDPSINDRKGVVTQFFQDRDDGRGQFLVRLGTEHSGSPTRFTGEKRYINPRHLVPISHTQSHHGGPSKTYHSVVIMSIVGNNPCVHTSFIITKKFMSMVLASLGDCPHPTLQHVRPFIMGTNTESVFAKLSTDVIDSSQNIPSRRRWKWFVENDEIVFPSRQSKQYINCSIKNAVGDGSPVKEVAEVIVFPSRQSKEYVDCTALEGAENDVTEDFGLDDFAPPCYEKGDPVDDDLSGMGDTGNTKNGDCESQCCENWKLLSTSETTEQGSGNSDQEVAPPESGFIPPDLEEHLNRPDQVRFAFPFNTANAIIPHASLHLNELSMGDLQKNVLIEDEILHGLQRYPIKITTKDVYSLYPHKNPSVAIVDLWTSW